MLFVLAFVSTAVAAVFDLRERRIPNAIPAALLACAAGLTAAGLHPLGWSQAVFGFVAATAITVPLYAISWMGGGDAKLLMALGATLGLVPFLLFFVASTAFGGVLALIAHRRKETEVAYAPAMLLGLIALASLPYLV